jgi:hypothetical protein
VIKIQLTGEWAMSAVSINLILIAIIALAATDVAHGQSSQTQKYIPPLPSADYSYPNAGAKIGQGWDSFNERGTTAACVEVAEARLETASFETHVEQIQSTYSLITKATTSVSAAYNGFGATASGSISTNTSLSINTDDQNFLFTFESSDGSTFAVPPGARDIDGLELSDQSIKGLTALKSEAAQQNYLAKFWERPPLAGGGAITLTPAALELRKKSQKDFDRICGDGFVSAIHRGGRINILLTQRLASAASANSLAASLSASGYGGSVSGSYSSSTQKLNSTDNLSYRVLQQGGTPLKPVALPSLGKDQFFDVNAILPAPDQLIANPTAFTVTITPYENAIADLGDSGEFPSPIRLLTLSDYYLALRDEYNLVESILNNVRTGLSDPSSQFDPRVIRIFGGEEGLESLYDSIHFDLAFLESAISQCYSEARACTVDSAVEEAMKGYRSQLLVLTATKTALEQVNQLNPVMGKATNGVPQAESANNDLQQSRQIDDAVTRLQELDSLTKDGKLDLKFFLKFYQYLSLTPLPKLAYSGPDFVALQQLQFLTSLPNDRASQLGSANDALKRANFSFRLTPWKRFFCQTLSSSPMCVPDSVLRSIAEDTQPTITGEQLTPVTPRATKPITAHIITVPGPCPRVGPISVCP